MALGKDLFYEDWCWGYGYYKRTEASGQMALWARNSMGYLHCGNYYQNVESFWCMLSISFSIGAHQFLKEFVFREFKICFFYQALLTSIRLFLNLNFQSPKTSFKFTKF